MFIIFQSMRLFKPSILISNYGSALSAYTFMLWILILGLIWLALKKTCCAFVLLTDIIMEYEERKMSQKW